jgi:DNA ligase (NAD+)
VVHFFKAQENRHILELLEKEGVNLSNQQKNQTPTDGLLSGKSFLFTGTLKKFKRSDAESMVEEKGGNILNTVSSKLHYLVVGDDAGSKLEKAKKLGTVTILNEQEFLDLITK